jgi:DNA-binding CsgD family transcriptional regulator
VIAYCGDVMPKQSAARMGDMSALVRTAKSLTLSANGEGVDRRRRLVAMFCTMLGEQALNGDAEKHASDGSPDDSPAISPGPPLSPRERQTLELLLTGNAEKQIAARLDISRHTVHVYVKSLYKRFGVNSRSELLAKWVKT